MSVGTREPPGALTFAALEALVQHGTHPDVRLLGGWLTPVRPAWPHGPALRLVYAYPAAHLAGMRPWRDALELRVPLDDHRMALVVAWEAAVWARLVLRAQPDACRALQGEALGENREAAAALAALVPDGEDIAPRTMGPGRWESVAAWLDGVRRGEFPA